MSVREAALAAWAAKQTRLQATRRSEEAERAAAVVAAHAEALAMVRDSWLYGAFPDAYWEVYDTATEHYGWFGHGHAVVCEGRPPGTDPTFAGVPCFMLSRVHTHPEAVNVWLVREEHADGYSHWDGPRVSSVEDVGEALASFDRQRSSRSSRGAEKPKVKTCPETGGACEHRDTCEGRSVITCWLQHARRASEPEGRTTGLHRDSMG